MPSSDKSVAQLLSQARKGSLVLPEFQRSFVWKLQDIRSFLASLCLDYPVGSFLTVEESADLFAARPLEGCSNQSIQPSPQGTLVYLLDGQQRLTSCHLVFSDSYLNENVRESVRRRWFLNLNALGLEDLTILSPEQLMDTFEEDAIVALPVDLKAKDRPEIKPEDDEQFREWCLEKGYYPLSFKVLEGNLDHALLWDLASQQVTKIANKKAYPPDSPERKELSKQCQTWVNWVLNLLNSLSKRTIPVLQIEQGATLEKVARVFETVNKTGMNLSLFELFVARATSTSSKSLRLIIEEARQEFADQFANSLLGKEAPEWDTDILTSSNVTKVFNAEFPKLVATLVQLDSGNSSLDLSKRAILGTPREEINKRAKQAASQLFRAIAFTQIKCGVPWTITACPYQAMLLPLAVSLNDTTWESHERLNRLEAWYWAAIFTGSYAKSQDRQARQDVFIVRDYVVNLGSKKPDSITSLATKFISYEALREIDEPGDGLYRAILQFVLSTKPFDLRKENHRLKPETPYTMPNKHMRKLEDHHIIPRAWLSDNRRNLESFAYVDSCLNRVYVSFEANRGREQGMFAQNPAQYLAELPDEILDSLFIPHSLKQELPDPLNMLLSERYAAIRNKVIEEVTSLA